MEVLAMLKSKLRVLSLGLLFASAIGLASCDDVVAKLPKAEQDVALLQNVGYTEKITHNDLETLYEKLVPGDSSSAEKVLNELLLKVAYAKYGHFYSYKVGDVTHDGVYEIMASKATAASVDEFNAKVAAWVDGEKLPFFKPTMAAGETIAHYNGRIAALVEDFYNHILEAVKKSFWNSVTSSTYQVRSVFIEYKFARAQKSNLYDIASAALGSPKETEIDGSDNYEDVEKYFADGYLTNYRDYIERSLLPDSYRKAIVEDYLRENNYTSLGHTYARKIQYIALADISGYSLATQRLVNAYAGLVLEATKAEMSATCGKEVDDAHVELFRDFHFLDRLYSGTYNQEDEVEEAMAKKIYEEASFEKVLIKGSTTDYYYPATKTGAIYKDYGELSDSRWTSGSSTDFTSGGAYTIETGLAIKLREAQAANQVTEGWYTSSELSSILSDLKTRLFKIQVANEVDSLKANATQEEVDALNASLSYGCYRQGSYYIVPATRQKPVEGEPYRPYLIYDKSSSSWVILRVDEAVKNSKLGKVSGSVDNPITYDDLAKAGRREGKPTENQIILTVAGMVAGSDTYVKAARQKVLQEGKLTYHDQSVYDYFKTTFPDLFD